MTIVSYDEKPGIQAIATTAPDLPAVPGVHPTFARDQEYKRHGTLSLLAGIDLLTGKVHALVKDRHRSREFVEFLKLLDAAYPARTAIKLILDNHSAHISRETRTWLDTRPAGRFQFTFTPKPGSWLNLVEGFFSKFARSVLRHIRVASKHELKERIMAGIDDVNRHPVVHTWSYKFAEAARYDSNQENADLGCFSRSLPPGRRPSPLEWRVGSHDDAFGACSVFTRKLRPARTDGPQKGPFLRVLQAIRCLLTRSEYFRLSESLPAWTSTRENSAPCQGTRSNDVERTIWPQTITRKSALFASSYGGGRTWATIAMLLQTAKMQDIDPHAKLTQTLELIALGWPIT
ncbi:hypothetical protein AOQ73_39925 [Bradyrhizobium pachyrhizi]|nr:hypothetical protein AOQ73_39925 [Bradyrhizobium pachyrhizi]